MRARHSLLIGGSIGLMALVGCGGGGKSRRASASTTAPTTSNVAPVNSSNQGPVSSGVVVVPPVVAPTLLTDALVSSFSMKQVIEVDAKTGAVKNQWSTGNGPTDVANKGTEVFVANALSQDITVVDKLANAVASTIDVTSTPITGVSLLSFADPLLKPLVRPTGIAFTPAGTKAYSANLLNVTVIDAATHRPTKSMLGIAPLNLASIISSPSTAISNFLAAPVPGLGMAKVAATNDHALVTCMISGKVMRIDARTDRVIDYVAVGRAPIGITIAQNKAYVACALSQEIYVIDVATGVVRSRLRGGMIPVDCSSNQAEDRVYVANAVSGDISVIDTAADIVIDTMPAGLSIASIFQSLGVTVPTGTSGGIGGLLNGFLQGFTGGMTNPSSFGALLAGGSGSLLSPANLINGLLSGFMAYAGLNSGALAGLNLPGIGIFSISVAHDPTIVCSANSLMGDLAVTETTTRNVSSLRGLTGMGLADVSAVWRR